MRRATVVLFALVSSVVLHAAEPGSGVGLSKLTDPRGLDNPVCRWNAKVIQVLVRARDGDVMTRPDNDYATFAYGRPWDFDNNTLEGISAHENLQGFQARDGKLTFTAGKDGYFYWGSHFSDDGKEKLETADGATGRPVLPRRDRHQHRGRGCGEGPGLLEG